jgi:hypothetical protein
MTLAVAIAALVVSVISLCLTAWQFQRSGTVLAVTVTDHKVPPEGHGAYLVSAEVTSEGRIDATVRRVEARVTPGPFVTGSQRFGPTKVSRELPARLKPSQWLEVEFELPIGGMQTFGSGATLWRSNDPNWSGAIWAQTGRRWFHVRVPPPSIEP